MTVTLAPGIAHVSFPGGGTFLPARTPYDLQVLAEHVADGVRTNGQAQVLIKNQRWTARVGLIPPLPGCAGCGNSLSVACCSNAPEGLLYCVKCAFAHSRRQPRRATQLNPDTRRLAARACAVKRRTA